MRKEKYVYMVKYNSGMLFVFGRKPKMDKNGSWHYKGDYGTPLPISLFDNLNIEPNVLRRIKIGVMVHIKL